MKHETFDGDKDSIRLKMNENERRQMDEAEKRFGEDDDLDAIYGLQVAIAEDIAMRGGIDLLDDCDYWFPERLDEEHLIAVRFCH